MSPRKAAPGHPERSRDRIIAAAAELAKERGVTGATVAAVCQRSGLPVSSLYWHFTDKDSLFAEVIRTSFASWLVTVPQWEVTPSTTLEDGLRGILGRSTRTLGTVPDFLRVGMQVLLEQGDQHAGTRAVFLDIRTQVRRMITAWLQAVLGTDVNADLAEDLAVLVVAFTDGLLVGSQLYDDFVPDSYVDLFVGMFREVLERAGRPGSATSASVVA